MTESYIERTYGSCDDDGHDDVSEQCWKYDNARLVLNGVSSRLVKDDTSGKWRLEGDDASQVTRSTGADRRVRQPHGWHGTRDNLRRPGRTLVTDAQNNVSRTAYTPVAAGPLTKTVLTNAKGHTAVTFLDPRRALPERTYDNNQNKTEQAYDGLGRLTQVWAPDRIRGSQSPNSTFAYHLSRTEPSSVATSTLKADGETYNTTYTVYDALLRPLQTQSPTPLGGRLLTDTRYDSRGLEYETYADIFDSTSTPKGVYTRAEYGEAPRQNETVFDGAGRPTTTALYTFGVKRWTASTSSPGTRRPPPR
ncbi:hypothetical protein SMICM17S_03019 [Streptomyces microflavus]